MRAFFPQRHAELVVLLCVAGQADYFVDGTVYPMQPGSLVWALAGQAHFLLDEQPGFDMWVMLVSRRVVPDHWQDDPAMPPFDVNPDRPAPAIRILPHPARDELSQIADGICQQADPSNRATGVIWWLLRAWHHAQRQPDGGKRLLHPAVAKAVSLIDDDPSLSLTAIAGQAGLSPGRLSKVFLAQMGEGFVAFRTRRRLQKVDALMRSDVKMPLLSAVLTAGFGSYTQFYRAFRQQRGQNPRAHYGIQTGDTP